MLNSVRPSSCSGTHIMYKCMLAHDQLKSYLGLLLDSKLLDYAGHDSNPYHKYKAHYLITTRGQEFITAYEEMERLMDGSGELFILPTSTVIPKRFVNPLAKITGEPNTSKLVMKRGSRFVNKPLMVAKIKEIMEEEPELDSYEIGKKLGVSRGTVYRIMVLLEKEKEKEKEKENKPAILTNPVGQQEKGQRF